jgi:hypothetical protein
MLENSFYTNNNVDKQVFNATSLNTVPYVVGQSALGGVIAYILQLGDPGYNANLQQGYVAAASDQTTSVWGASGISAGATAQALGTGQANTTAILAATAERPIAASVAAEVTDGGYTDWYLPSLQELLRLFTNRVAIGGFNTTGVRYWSSSEQPTLNGFVVDFNTGSQSVRPKTELNRVRAIRSFSVSITPTPWQTWSKPEGRNMAYIVCIGGGGGGSAGQTNSSAATSGAGGGGSAITIAQVPFYSIPDTLYIQVALGGIGGTATSATGNAGSSGGISYVSCYPTIDMFNCLLINGNIAGAGGGVNSAVGGGAGGAALSASSTTNPRYLSLCNWASYAGQAGMGGSLGAAAGITMALNSICSGGTCGGGAQGIQRSAGAPLNSGDTLTSFLKTILGGAAPSGRGTDGYSYLKPFLFTSGTGGGGSVLGVAGVGGNGNIGSGGGGGGAGSGALGVAANGGNGGNGLVMIISY